MKRLIALSVMVLFTGATSAGEIKKEGDTYFQAVGVVAYSVDAVTQQCYVVRTNFGGLAPIPCEILARRPDWTPILTWVGE